MIGNKGVTPGTYGATFDRCKSDQFIQNLCYALGIRFDPDRSTNVKTFGEVTFRCHQDGLRVGPSFQHTHGQTFAERGEDESVAIAVAGGLSGAELGPQEQNLRVEG